MAGHSTMFYELMQKENRVRIACPRCNRFYESTSQCLLHSPCISPPTLSKTRRASDSLLYIFWLTSPLETGNARVTRFSKISNLFCSSCL